MTTEEPRNDENLDQAPAAHVFYDTHVAWLAVNDDLPKKPVEE